MLRMPRKGREKASCGELGLVEGKEKLTLLSGKTLFTRQQVHHFPPSRLLEPMGRSRLPEASGSEHASTLLNSQAHARSV